MAYDINRLIPCPSTPLLARAYATEAAATGLRLTFAVPHQVGITVQYRNDNFPPNLERKLNSLTSQKNDL